MRVVKNNDDLRKQIDSLEKMNRTGAMSSVAGYTREPNRAGTTMGNHEKSTNSGFLEELSYSHNLES
jgi:hypothetical protein